MEDQKEIKQNCIQLTKNSRGFGWRINVYGDDSIEIKKTLDDLNSEMEKTYEKKNKKIKRGREIY